MRYKLITTTKTGTTNSTDRSRSWGVVLQGCRFANFTVTRNDKSFVRIPQVIKPSTTLYMIAVVAEKRKFFGKLSVIN